MLVAPQDIKIEVQNFDSLTTDGVIGSVSATTKFCGCINTNY